MFKLRAKARAPESLSVGGGASAADIWFSTTSSMVGRWGNHEKVTSEELLRMHLGAAVTNDRCTPFRFSVPNRRVPFSEQSAFSCAEIRNSGHNRRAWEALCEFIS